MRWFLGFVALALALAAPAGAQTSDAAATKRIGEWILTCKVDAITDAATCHAFLPLTDEAGRYGGMLRVVDTEQGFEVRLLAKSLDLEKAWLRIDREPALDLGCVPVEPLSLCPFAAADVARITGKVTTGERVLVRLVGRAGSADYGASLAETPAAWAEFRRLREAARQEPEKSDAEIGKALDIARSVCVSSLPADRAEACKAEVARCVAMIVERGFDASMACQRKAWAAR
jgi:hypothetical protein